MFKEEPGLLPRSEAIHTERPRGASAAPCKVSPVNALREALWLDRWAENLRRVDPEQLDAYLDQVLIGGRERRPVVLAEPDPAWARRFAHERARILAALGPSARRVEHIGSTAVPGLAAKPIVDVLVAVRDADDDRIVVALERAGYLLRVREPGHRMLRTAALDVHVHVWGEEDPEVDRCLRFRDRLRASAEDRAAYEGLKRELATRDWADLNEYANAKGPLIEAILARGAG